MRGLRDYYCDGRGQSHGVATEEELQMTPGSVPRYARKRHLLIRDEHGESNGQAYRAS